MARQNPRGVSGAPPPLLARLWPTLRGTILPAYEARGDVAFAYVQGSIVAGYSTASDLDVVVVWREAVPAAARRPATLLNRSARDSECYDQPGFVLDRFWIGGQQYDVTHRLLSDLRQWIDLVVAGGGWRELVYPLPLVAVAGFRYGRIVRDPGRAGATLRRRLESFPEALRAAPRAAVREALPGYQHELARCAARGDGLLFHELLGQVVRLLFVAWFSAHGVYFPHEKWLGRSIRAFGLGAGVAELERRLWLSGPGLEDRRRAFSELTDRMLADME